MILPVLANYKVCLYSEIGNYKSQKAFKIKFEGFFELCRNSQHSPLPRQQTQFLKFTWRNSYVFFEDNKEVICTAKTRFETGITNVILGF